MIKGSYFNPIDPGTVGWTRCIRIQRVKRRDAASDTTYIVEESRFKITHAIC